MIINKQSALTPTTRKMAMQLIRAINKDPEFRKAKLYGHIFETRRTQSRQNKLFQEGKSWVRKSPHQNGSAFDLVLCYKKFKPLRITKIFWDNSIFYSRIAEMANEIGLYSYGLVYKKDAFHFELPLIWQPESDCFAYAIINALRTHDAGWRIMKKENARQCAERLQEIAYKIHSQETTTNHSLFATLSAAKSLGWILDFSEINPSEVTNTMCCVCQTRRKNLGGEGWVKIYEMINEGKGIPSHATAIKKQTRDGLVIFNSHSNIAEYVISDYSSILKTYKISL